MLNTLRLRHNWAARLKPADSWVILLRQLRPSHLPEVGAKAYALGRMSQAGLLVPPGFVVLAAAFQQFVRTTPGWDDLEEELSNAKITDPDGIASLSCRIHGKLIDQPFPEAVDQAIQSALAKFPGARQWAVRSSATIEDLPEASFAGQHESYLNAAREDLIVHVRKCWLSLFGARSILYRIHNGLGHNRAAMAVIIQEMVAADRAGVLFTADPVFRYQSRIVIEAAAGLGQNVVNGRASTECIVITRRSSRIVKRTRGNAPEPVTPLRPEAAIEQCLAASASKDDQKQTASQDHRADRPSITPGRDGIILDDDTARRLAILSQKAERLLSGPLDIEWATCDGQCYLLQARPMTGQARVKTWEDKQVWSNLNTGEVMPDVMAPITWSMIQFFLCNLARSVFAMAGIDIDRAPVCGLVAGRSYFNATTGLAAMKPFWFLIEGIPNFAQALGGGQIDWHQQGLLDIPEEDLPDLGFSWPGYILSWPKLLCQIIAHSPRRGDQWTKRIKARADELSRLSQETMPTTELLGCLDQMLQYGFEGWDLLYLGTQAAALPIFQAACRNWLGDPGFALGYRLFAALGEIPETQAGLALWKLAELAHRDTQLERTLLSTESWTRMRAELESREPGRRFLEEWQAFMAEHGHHCRGELELFNARWSETPDYILGVVRSYLRSIAQDSQGSHNPLKDQQRLAREREQLTEQCLQRLKNPIKRWIFSRSLRRAQKLAINREEWKNQAVRQITFMRRILKLLGERLQGEGILDRADDIFFLELMEVRPVAARSACIDARTIIEKRRREYQKNLDLRPPPVVIGNYNPESQLEPAFAQNGTVLKGIAVFPGIVTGRARVILRTDDHEQVRPGEILVAPFTDPAWTPYFIPAAGVAIDQGGILSHGSIIAREYGLPSVTNLGCATRVIRTGDLIQVNGNLGQVRVLANGEDDPGMDLRKADYA